MEPLLDRLNRVERLAQAGKLHRFMAHPLRYVLATVFRYLVYPRTRKGILVEATTFFQKPMHLLLPAGTDIYLTGGKSHASEIRLARFLIRTLQPGDGFLDIGAHFGFFSLLASTVVGAKGRVCAVEPALGTFDMLRTNTSGDSNIQCYNVAVSDEPGQRSFFEFPILYSEYNALDAIQYESAPWYAQFKPKEITVEAVVLDQFLEAEAFRPRVVKIDVEGGEFHVLSGMRTTLSQPDAPVVVMEYLRKEKTASLHHAASQLLLEAGFTPFRIDTQGKLAPLSDIEAYLSTTGQDSDNIVFCKPRL